MTSSHSYAQSDATMKMDSVNAIAFTKLIYNQIKICTTESQLLLLLSDTTKFDFSIYNRNSQLERDSTAINLFKKISDEKYNIVLLTYNNYVIEDDLRYIHRHNLADNFCCVVRPADVKTIDTYFKDSVIIINRNSEIEKKLIPKALILDKQDHIVINSIYFLKSKVWKVISIGIYPEYATKR